jgi:exosortase D (VPLPA-CTERM-specific)
MAASKIADRELSRFIFPLVIIVCLIFSYWSVFPQLIGHWDDGDNSYCYLVIPLFLYLCWNRREIRNRSAGSKVQGVGQEDLKAKNKSTDSTDYADELKIKDEVKLAESDTKTTEQVKLSESFGFKFGEFSWNVWGIIPILLSIGLIFLGELGSIETFLYMGIWACVVSIVFLLYGRRIYYLTFPLVILFFIVPLPPFINRMVTFELKMAASSLAVVMMRLFGVSVLQEGNIIDLGISQLQVVDACSGMRYLMPLILLALLVGYFAGKGWWRKAVLLLLVVPLSVVLNAFRIFLTGMLTVKGHAELAESFFHDFSGWLIFMAATAILALATLILGKIGSTTTVKPKIDPGGIVFGFKRAVALTVVVCLMFAGSGWAIKQVPSARNLPNRLTFKNFPMQIGDWQGKRSYLSKEILDSLWADDYVTATYFNTKTRNALHLLIPFYEYQGTKHTAHAPQSCLLGGGWDLLGNQQRSVKVDPGRNVKIMTMVLKKGDTKILGSYFFLQRGRVITSPWMNKFYLMWDAFTKQRTDGALVRAEMVLAPGQSFEEANAVLEDFITRLWETIQPYVPA